MDLAQNEFDQFWTVYPRHIAKKAALKAYTQVRKEISAECILASVAIMKETVWRGRKLEYLPYPATFLRAEAFEERTEMVEDETSPEERSPCKHFHWCKGCDHGHAWQCNDEECIYPDHALCEQIAKMRAAIKV